MSTALETTFGQPGVIGLSDDPHSPTFVSSLLLPETDYKGRYNAATSEIPGVGASSTWQYARTATPPTLPPDDVAVLRSPDYKKDTDSFRVMQKWQGHVLEVRDDVFLARLSDLTGKSPPEDIELEIGNVAAQDRNLLRVGAVFYWRIGYLDRLDGQRIRASVIRFRRRPVWREDEIQTARETARKWAALWVKTD
jgi:hypothetical protein